ncbi:MAG: sensor histidine kinase [Flavobacteriales bacterium]|nr:sensor histidine kinase [Flavobacteriales bacterium]
MSKVRSGRTLLISIVGVLAIGAGLLLWAISSMQERKSALGEMALLRTQQLVQLRLNGLFSEMAEDIREEAAAIEISDSTVVFDRWYPLLRTHWPILSIKLANEVGDELALIREDSTFLVTRTAAGSVDGPPILMRYTGGQRLEVTEGPWLDHEDNDPRERVWFSKALEESQNEPCWTLRPPETDGDPMLQVSYLIRDENPDRPYRVLMFTVDLTRSSWLDSRSAALTRPGILLLDDEGRSLGHVRGQGDEQVEAATDLAEKAWQTKKTFAPFTVQVGDQQFGCSFVQFPLNGQQLNTGVVLNTDRLIDWLLPEWRVLIASAVFLLVLITLLTWAYLKKRSSDENLRKQTRRTRTQEVKLAKALGERDVLNREVHHRVKNNLQVVSSLLNLQATRLEDGAVKSEFLRGKRRIDTIALVHHKLYGLVDLRNVDLFRFFTDLVKALAEMYLPQSRLVSFEVNTDHTKADQDTAIELGIILCELVSNSFQHAFPYVTGGHVEIRVSPMDGDLYRLTVKDNGKGITDDAREGTGKLGLEIVEALSEQLDGSFHVQVDGGVLFEVLFRMRHPSPILPDTDREVAGTEE